MKKKLFAIVLIACMAFAVTACGGNETSSPESDEPAQEEVKKVEKSFDAVEAELGLSNGEETLYQFINATMGKEYNGGEVELYQFDEDSDAYKAIEDGTFADTYNLEVAGYNGGFALIFPNEVDSALVDKLEAIVFE